MPDADCCHHAVRLCTAHGMMTRIQHIMRLADNDRKQMCHRDSIDSCPRRPLSQLPCLGLPWYTSIAAYPASERVIDPLVIRTGGT